MSHADESRAEVLRDLVVAIGPAASLSAMLEMPLLSAETVCAQAVALFGRESVAVGLRSVVGDKDRSHAQRAQAVRLSNSLCDRAAWSALSAVIGDSSEPDALVDAAIDAAERLVFARVVGESEVQNISREALSRRPEAVRGKWLGLLGTLGGAWARAELERVVRADEALREEALRALGSMREPEADAVVRAAAAEALAGAAEVSTAILGQRAVEQGRAALASRTMASSGVATQLIESGKFAVLHRLLSEGLLPAEVIESLRAVVPSPSMTRSQRKFLAEIRNAIERRNASE